MGARAGAWVGAEARGLGLGGWCAGRLGWDWGAWAGGLGLGFGGWGWGARAWADELGTGLMGWCQGIIQTELVNNHKRCLTNI